MSARGLVHDKLFIFDGTNYDMWKIYMLNILRAISPDSEQILDSGFPSPKDSQNRSVVEERNSILDALASHAFSNIVCITVTSSIMPF